MQKQQKSESDLLRTYGRIITLTLVLVIMAVIASKHFSSVESIGTKGLQLEHSRLLYVLAMVKSQWLSQGRPSALKLSWEDTGVGSANRQLDEVKVQPQNNIIQMSPQGWPLLNSSDEAGCRALWQQLMASDLHDIKADVFYQKEPEICRFTTEQSGSISYQASSGRVIFLEGSD
ncbi:hypothetical protein A9267_12390 [Shewanella sp. UCD-FRSSP16_17]|uniref:hypothetical protein n=1 Tax=unclassified Shewanella TaxID=196818 RepID=UPI0007EEAF19|nr:MULTISPECIES: hypothetical protein [unclassified Shewanella]MBQ4890832.1 MSHA biogenesis protein MshF [Shewanella sp. MMG014]OBT06703.1 hypothetical protein A9267_12390 [Shewanella sp. UCD-FRSSP16_17]